MTTLTSRLDRQHALHPRLLLAAVLVSLVMLPLSLFLGAVGVLVLKVSGGADADTSMVVFVAAVLVTDFWGGGLVRTLTRAHRTDVAISWGLARAVLLAAMALLSPKLALLAPIMWLLAVPAALTGARVAAAQAALRRDAERELRDDRRSAAAA